MLTPQIEDLTIREKQLKDHLLRSPLYVRRARRALWRQIWSLFGMVLILFATEIALLFKPARAETFLLQALMLSASVLGAINCRYLLRRLQTDHSVEMGQLESDEKKAVRGLVQSRAKLKEQVDLTRR